MLTDYPKENIEAKNVWEKACREWLKGCSCDEGDPEDCEECTKAFLAHVKRLGARGKELA